MYDITLYSLKPIILVKAIMTATDFKTSLLSYSPLFIPDGQIDRLDISPSNPLFLVDHRYGGQ